MGRISDLSDELLVKILSFLPTKVAVSTSILSKQWQFLWLWLPNLEFNNISGSMSDFINKNLPLHKAPIIESLCLTFDHESLHAENFKTWIEIAVSRGLRELISISDDSSYCNLQCGYLFLPSSLYTCNSLGTLKLDGQSILVDVPQTVDLPSLKTLQFTSVTYSNEESLQLLLSCCPVLEDLTIDREWEDSVETLVISIPTLQRLSLITHEGSYCNRYEIVTPSLKYFQVVDDSGDNFYLIEHLPELEKADISVIADNVMADNDNEIDIEKLFKSITTVKHLSVRVKLKSGNETLYGDGIVFTQLENLKLYICSNNWSKILFQLLKDSPNLQILDLVVDDYDQSHGEYKPVSWSNDQSVVPNCLVKSLTTLKFKGYSEEKEQKDVLSFICKHAKCLKSTSLMN